MKTSSVFGWAVTSKEMSFPRLLLSGAVDSCVSPLLQKRQSFHSDILRWPIWIFKFFLWIRKELHRLVTSYSLLEDLKGSRLMACSTGWAGGLRVVGVRLAALPPCPAEQATLRGQSHVCNSWLKQSNWLGYFHHFPTDYAPIDCSDVSIIRLIGRFHQRKASFAYALLL